MPFAACEGVVDEVGWLIGNVSPGAAALAANMAPVAGYIALLSCTGRIAPHLFAGDEEYRPD